MKFVRCLSKTIKEVAKNEDYQSELINQLNAISMLNKESLRALHYLGSKSQNVLELGSYVGGSSIAIASGGGINLI
jgi:hypothetical protein